MKKQNIDEENLNEQDNLKIVENEFRPLYGINNPFENVKKQILFSALPILEFQNNLSKISKVKNQFETAISEIIDSNFLIKYSKIEKALNILGSHQIVVWRDFKYTVYSKIIKQTDINRFYLELLTNKTLPSIKSVIMLIKESDLINTTNTLFEQSIKAFNNTEYHICLVGLICILDDLLSKITNNLTTNFKDRFEKIIKDFKSKNKISFLDTKFWILSLTYTNSLIILNESIPFQSSEPQSINRHWIMHGRMTREATKLDCIKMINIMYGSILLSGN